MVTLLYICHGIDPVTSRMDLASSQNQTANYFARSMQDATGEVQNATTTSNQSAAEYANNKRVPVEYKIGDLVCLSTKNLSPKKVLAPAYFTPSTLDHWG